MAIYCIIAHKGAPVLGAKVKELYPDYYELPPSVWFVADTGTALQMREKLGLNAKELGAQGVQGLVIQSAGTSGFAPSDIWDWLRIKMESQPHG
jgi:hypothetical protein